MKYRIAAISDMHNDFPEPSEFDDDEINLLIVAGDITKYGTLNELKEFNRWLGKLLKNHRFDGAETGFPTEVVVIAGNHDLALQRIDNRKMFEDHLAHHTQGRAHYLEHQQLVLKNGLKVFGTPYVPKFCEMAFNRDHQEREKLWADISDDVSILVTHTPAMGLLDQVEVPHLTQNGTYLEELGCKFLRARVDQLQYIKSHIFGHIHEAGGMFMRENHKKSLYVVCNAARKESYNEGSRKPQIFEIEI